MRETVLATLGLIFLAFLARVAPAQITFTPGPSRTVPRGPQFAAAADFNNDGLADAVSIDTIADKITVLFGSTDGGFESAVDRQVGNLLRGVATGDFNGDHNQDIAVVDVNLSRVFILAGNGNGTFNSTGNFLTARKGPYGIAVGNFDNKNGPDIVTANGAANSLTTLYNLGRNSGFAAQPNIAIGQGPKAVGTGDFNGDGFDDIVVVNTGQAGTDQLTILLNNGVGSFQQSVPMNFTVGKGARALTIDDFNGDGVPDVAVLNSIAIAPNTFAISILINKTIIPQGSTKSIGTGMFNVEQGTTITCPSNIKLVPVTCTPSDIKSGDFDGDGFNDLVISVSTAAVGVDSTTAGFVTALAGRGDGTFDFATQVLVGVGPRQMAIGDFNGDGRPDVFLTQFSENSVRILRSVTPPPQPGDSCRLGAQCQSTFCVDHVCCGTPSCPAGQVCSIKEFPGQCHVPFPGNGCNDPAQCQSQFCVDGSCCSTPTCPDGEFCNTGQCGPPTGGPCTSPDVCDTGFCTDGVCCDSDTCLDPDRCDILGSEGMCSPPLLEGDECEKNTDCEDPLICSFNPVSDRFECGGPLLPTPTRPHLPTPTPTPRIHITVGSGRAGPGEPVSVAVSLATSGASVVATSNDITFNSEALTLSTCGVNPAIGKTLAVSSVAAGTIRIFVQSRQNTSPISDGPLYTCTFRIAAFALPDTYPLRNDNPIAFSPAGTRLPDVAGAGGSITVSLVPQACPGDCDGNASVTIDELITGVNTALGTAPIAACLAFDLNGDGTVTVDELIAGVNNALNGCTGGSSASIGLRTRRAAVQISQGPLCLPLPRSPSPLPAAG